MNRLLPGIKWIGIAILATLILSVFIVIIQLNGRQQNITATGSNESTGFDGSTAFTDPLQPLNSILPYFERMAKTIDNNEQLLYAAYIKDSSGSSFIDGKSIIWYAQYAQLSNDPNVQNNTVTLKWSGLQNKISVMTDSSSMLVNQATGPIAETLAETQIANIAFEKTGQDCYQFFGVFEKDNQTLWQCTSREGKTVTVNNKELNNSNNVQR